MTALRGAVQQRLTERDDRGSLPMAILVMIVGLGLAALMLPMVLTQSSTTRFDQRRAVSLQAAESGLDAALGLIRASVSYDEKAMEMRGDARKLPCGPLSGTIDPTSKAQYSVTIAYYTSNPTGWDDQKLSEDKMSCVSGFGVHFDDDSATGILVPSFALITSRGTNGTSDAGRTLQATYIVNTTNVNIDGGLLPLFPDQSVANPVEYCLDAGPDPRAGSAVKIQPCSADAVAPDEQRWAYRMNLTIQLTATINNTDVNPNGGGLCVSADGFGATTLQPCPKDATDPATGNPLLPDDYRLIWGINDSGHFAQSNSARTDLSGQCLNAGNLRSGGPVNLAGCSGGTTDPHQAFNPRPQVGSGQAGPESADPDFLTGTPKQVVNFQQFSRCVDVTNQNTGTGDNGGTFLILYPCKQNPNPDAVAWNQKFQQVTVPGGVQWRTIKDGTRYCVTSPLAPSTATSKKYVHVETCQSGRADQVWTRNEGSASTADGQQTLPTKQRYTMVDSADLCLAPSDNDDMYAQNLKTVVAPCDGSMGQKWNVPPTEQRANLTDLHESGVRE